jgi:hypothetical protein
LITPRAMPNAFAANNRWKKARNVRDRYNGPGLLGSSITVMLCSAGTKTSSMVKSSLPVAFNPITDHLSRIWTDVPASGSHMERANAKPVGVLICFSPSIS